MYRRLRGDLIEAYKITNGFYNVNAEDYLTLNKDTRTRGHCYKLAKQACHLDIRKNYFSLRIVETWNSLPECTVTAPSINSFKNKVDRLLHKYKFCTDFPLKPVLRSPQVGGDGD